MIQTYGFSIIGSSHEKKGGICQDANKIISLGNGQIIIAAVADGVGSCTYSDIAAKIAVEISTVFCEANFKQYLKRHDFEKLIEGAFSQVELEIEKQSLKDDQPLSEYDTTLDLVIYFGKKVYYGHCGDGGIIGLTVNGNYLKITSPQKKDGMYVIPLRDGSNKKNNTWEFGEVKEDLASVLLATDGVYDIFFPYLLKGQPVEIYVPLIQYFMDNNGIHISEKSKEEISKSRREFFTGSDSASITDDKTMIVLINEKVNPKKKDALFYVEPDWDALQLEWNKKAYPHLYENKENPTNKNESVEPKQSVKSTQPNEKKCSLADKKCPKKGY